MNYIKKYWALFIICAIGVFFVPDWASFVTYLYRLGISSFLILLFLTIVGNNKTWGLFPELDIKELLESAEKESLSSSIIFASIIYLLSTIIDAVVR